MRTFLAVVLAAVSVHPAAAQVVRTSVAAPQGASVGVPVLPAQPLSGPSSFGASVDLGPGSVLPSVNLPTAESLRPSAAAAVPRRTAQPRTAAAPLAPARGTETSKAPAPLTRAAVAAPARRTGLRVPALRPVLKSPVISTLRKAGAGLGAAKDASQGARHGRPQAHGRVLNVLFDGWKARAAADEAEVPSAPAGILPSPSGLRKESGTGAETRNEPPAPSRFGFLRKPSVGKALAATAFFKVSMETLSIIVPLLALQVFGSATWLATMAVAWGGMMTLSSMIAGGRMDRAPVSRILATALVSQAVLVGAMAALFLTGAATPWNILPLHALSGAAMGVVLTGRDTLPARLLGRSHRTLSKFNSTVHIVYEIAGTAAPLLLGVLITGLGLEYALLLHPPAALLAAALFFTVRLLPSPALKAAAKEADERPLLRGIVSDVKEGSRFFRKSRAYAWLGFMLLMPMVIHRVFEQMVVPVFVSTILKSPQSSAWIVSSSNFGELLGALLLLKYMLTPRTDGRKPSPFRFMRLMAVGTLGVWALGISPSLWIIAPMIFLMSVSWAANDLSMTAYFQSSLPEESAGKAIGFLMAAELAVIMGMNYLFGVMFDLIPVMWGVALVGVVCTLLAYAFWRGKSRLKHLTQSGRLVVPARPKSE